MHLFFGTIKCAELLFIVDEQYPHTLMITPRFFVEAAILFFIFLIFCSFDNDKCVVW
jgi:hypothetical protein